MELSIFEIIIIVVVGGVFIFWLAFRGVKAQKCTKKYHENNFAGEIGVAKSDIPKNQKGEIFIHGELWKAVALDDIKKGDEVIAIYVKKFVVYAKKYEGE
jgi:membrane-bound ClpP family serine protease